MLLAMLSTMGSHHHQQIQRIIVVGHMKCVWQMQSVLRMVVLMQGLHEVHVAEAEVGLLRVVVGGVDGHVVEVVRDVVDVGELVDAVVLEAHSVELGILVGYAAQPLHCWFLLLVLLL